MSANPSEILEDILGRVDICGRCFGETEPTGGMNSFGSSTSCGPDCGQISASLGEEPLSRDEITARGSRLLSCVQEENYDINDDAFENALDLLAGSSEPPRMIFLDSIRASRGETNISDLMEQYGIESEDEQPTQDFLQQLPTVVDSPESQLDIHEEVLSEITSVTDEPFPGSNVYYLSNPERIPDAYTTPNQANDPEAVMGVVIRENESWFWRVSPQLAEKWLEALRDEHQNHAAPALFNLISSRHRFTIGDETPPDEQFRGTCLWPVFKEEAEDIMGYLRRHDEPKAIEDIAEFSDYSIRTVRILLFVLQDTETVDDGSGNTFWMAT